LFWMATEYVRGVPSGPGGREMMEGVTESVVSPWCTSGR
jgi:hypothetical protein